MHWFREWRAWIKAQKMRREIALRGRIVSEIREGVAVHGIKAGDYIASTLISIVREHDKKGIR
jgi:hypothetical protein